MARPTAREITRIPAVLCGVDNFRIAGCLLETWTEYSSARKPYTRCRIVHDPPNLPDGPYRIEFAGKSIRTNKVDGQWELIFLAPSLGGKRAA